MGYATVVSSAFDSSACALGCDLHTHIYTRITHSHTYHRSCLRMCVLLSHRLFHSVIHFARVLRSLSSPSSSLPFPSLLRARAMSMLHFLPFPPPLDTDVSEEEVRRNFFASARPKKPGFVSAQELKPFRDPTVSAADSTAMAHWRNYLRRATAKTAKSCTL